MSFAVEKQTPVPNTKSTHPVAQTRWYLAVAAVMLMTPWATHADDAATPAFKVLDSIEARAQGCATCHGQRGQGTRDDYFPRLAGKPAGYLYNQLVAFRDGTRKYAPMNYLVAYLPDAYLLELAEHFSKERPPYFPPGTSKLAPAALERGAQLAMQGDAARQIPACVACHGAALTGMEPGIPALVGLRGNYLTAQLTRWRSKERHAASPDCMQRVASRLTDNDIANVSAWLASRPAPADPSPIPRGAMRTPLACGSQS